jgi:hypothetical protein
LVPPSSSGVTSDAGSSATASGAASAGGSSTGADSGSTGADSGSTGADSGSAGAASGSAGAASGSAGAASGSAGAASGSAGAASGSAGAASGSVVLVVLLVFVVLILEVFVVDGDGLLNVREETGGNGNEKLKLLEHFRVLPLQDGSHTPEQLHGTTDELHDLSTELWRQRVSSAFLFADRILKLQNVLVKVNHVPLGRLHHVAEDGDQVVDQPVPKALGAQVRRPGQSFRGLFQVRSENLELTRRLER